MSLSPPRREGAIPLEDGRQLAYAEYGDPTGTPALFFHGWPGCRLQGALFHDAATRHNVRFIAVDRPGSGKSTLKRGRNLLDWPDDIAQLARTLGLDRFAVAGLSGGAPYALACAYRMPERLSATLIISGAPAYLTERTGFFRRVMLAAVRRSKWIVRFNLTSFRFWLRAAPRVTLFFYRNSWMLSKRDKELWREWSVEEYLPPEVEEAFRQGTEGPAQDYVIYASAWGFSVKDVHVPVQLWHGEADRIVRIGPVREQASMLLNANARFYPGEGHLMLLDHLDEILSTITAATGAASTASR